MLKVRQGEASLAEEIIGAIRTVIGNKPVALHEPRFKGNELKYIKECIESTYVSTAGRFINQFEDELCSITGSRYAVGIVNGTEALHVSLLLAGVKQKDEVLVPTLSFVATANAVRYCEAVPHFLDCEECTLGINPHAIREYLKSISEIRNKQCFNKKTGCRIHALVPVHVFGHPCNLEGLLGVARDFNLVLIEDSAESLGSFYYGKHTGTFGKLGTMSFNGNKTVTTGGGGVILTQDKEMAVRAKHLTTTAKLNHKWEYNHNEVGFNYRIPNLNAALGCAQLEQLTNFLESKRLLYTRYRAAIADIDGVKLFSEPEGCRSNYWLQTLCVAENESYQRDNILQATNDVGLMTRPVWKLLHTLKPFRNSPRAPLPVAESLERRLINIPSSAGLV